MAEAADGFRVARHPIIVTFLCAGMLLLGFGEAAAHADVTAVKGSAYGYFSRVSLFGGAPADRGPAPTVTLPPGGSAVPITATAATGDARYGPGIIFTSGPITVSTQGTTGPSGSVTTSTSIQNINTSRVEVFTAAAASSTCTASQAGVSGSTTITNGTLQTSDGNPDVSGDETVVAIPSNPAPNTTYNGTLNSTGDTFRYVFNEQTVNPDGSLTVSAGHLYLIGPTAVGNLLVGQSVCGVTAPPDNTPPDTTITSGPVGTTNDSTPTFAFTSSEAGSSFTCALDAGAFTPCTSPHTTAALAQGPHTFRVRARDSAGNTDATPATRSFTVDTSAPPPPPLQDAPGSLGATSTPSDAPDQSAPLVSAYGVSNAAFLVAKTPTALNGVAAAKLPTGTTFKYTLSEPASVKIDLQQVLAGRKRGASCVKPPAKPKGATCTRYLSRGKLTRTSHAGANSVAFSGRLASTPLKPGRYRAQLVATDAAGNSSVAQTVTFRVLPGV